MNGQKCPICQLQCSVENLPDYISAYLVKCRRCGFFKIDRIMLRALETGLSDVNDQSLLPYLSCYTRQTYERGILGEIEPKNWREYAAAHMGTRIGQKQNKLTQYVAQHSSLGKWAQVDSELDYPLIDGASGEEITFLAEDLKEDGYVDCQLDRNRITALKLTVKGWKSVDPAAGEHGIPGRCFVAMPFHPSLNDAYDLGIRPALEKDCGMQAMRIDLIHHNEKICDKIIAEIRQAQFIVADCTNHRLNVYFEAGFALGLGRPVIWMCRDDEFEKLKDSFDTRQYNHIKWSSPEDLRKQLAERIQATILR